MVIKISSLIHIFLCKCGPPWKTFAHPCLTTFVKCKKTLQLALTSSFSVRISVCVFLQNCNLRYFHSNKKTIFPIPFYILHSILQTERFHQHSQKSELQYCANFHIEPVFMTWCIDLKTKEERRFMSGPWPGFKVWGARFLFLLYV